MSKISERKERNNKRKRSNKYQVDYLVKQNMLSDVIDKLQEGQEFSNWPDLFDYLDLYYPDGGARTTYQNHLKRYVRISNYTGTNLVIEEIYNEPIEWIDGRKKGNHSVYVTFFSSVLLWVLLQEKEKNNQYALRLSYTDFWRIMGIKNSYYNNKDVQKLLPEFDKDMTPELLDDFFRWTGSKSKAITDYILESLREKGLLEYRRIRTIKEKNGIRRKATDEEESLIGSEEKRLMNEWGFKTRKELFMSGKSQLLYKEIKDKLKLAYYYEIEIIIYEKDVLTIGLKDNIIELKKELGEEVSKNKIGLNNKITEYDIRNAEKRQLKEKDKIDEEYKHYVDTRALGKVMTLEEYIEQNGHALYYDDTYAERFKKATHYFSDLKLSEDMRDTLIAAEAEAERRRLEELEKLKKEGDL